MSSAELSGAVTTDDESVTSGQVILFNDIDDVFLIFIIVAHARSSAKFSAEGTLRHHAEEEPRAQAADEEGQKNSAEVMSCLEDKFVNTCTKETVHNSFLAKLRNTSNITIDSEGARMRGC